MPWNDRIPEQHITKWLIIWTYSILLKQTFENKTKQKIRYFVYNNVLWHIKIFFKWKTMLFDYFELYYNMSSKNVITCLVWQAYFVYFSCMSFIENIYTLNTKSKWINTWSIFKQLNESMEMKHIVIKYSLDQKSEDNGSYPSSMLLICVTFTSGVNEGLGLSGL